MSMLGCGASCSSCATLGRAGSRPRMAGGGGNCFAALSATLGRTHDAVPCDIAPNSVPFGDVTWTGFVDIFQAGEFIAEDDDADAYLQWINATMLSPLFDEADDPSQEPVVTAGRTDTNLVWPLRALWNAAGEAPEWVELPPPATGWSRGHLPGGHRKPTRLLPRQGRARTRRTLDLPRGPERTYRKSGRAAPGEGYYQTGATRREADKTDEDAWRTPPAQRPAPTPRRTPCEERSCPKHKQKSSERDHWFHLRRAAQVTGLPQQSNTPRARKRSAAPSSSPSEARSLTRAVWRTQSKTTISHGAAKTSAAHAAACQATPRGRRRGTWCWRHRRTKRSTNQIDLQTLQCVQCLIWAMIAHVWFIPAGH